MAKRGFIHLARAGAGVLFVLLMLNPGGHRRAKSTPVQTAVVSPRGAGLAIPSVNRPAPPPDTNRPAQTEVYRVAAKASSPSQTPDPGFGRFQFWMERFLRAGDKAAQDALESEGILLAQHRRDDLIEMIEGDPQRALELGLPEPLRRRLPVSIQALLEKRVNGRGRLAVLAAVPEPGKENEITPVFRTAELAGQTYQAFVYGRRLGEPTREDIAIHGLAIDDRLAVHEDPMRLMDKAETDEATAAAPAASCAFCGRDLAGAAQAAGGELAGETMLFCGHDHASQYNEQQITAEQDLPSAAAPVALLSTSWTTGTKNILLIRVDFSDLPGEPFSDETGLLMISNVNIFYRDNSYGKAGFTLYGQGSDITPTFRMPKASAYYGTNNFYAQLRSDARAAAATAGYNLGNFNFDLICFGSVPGWGWAGLGYIGAAGVWLRGYFTTGVAAHELGHNFGLPHANFWDTSGNGVIGAGKSIEYGDKFDTMGSAEAAQKHFNARFKNYLSWLPSGDVRTFSTNGLYQIYPHDLTNAAGFRAIKIPKNNSTNYWVEFRQKYTGNKWLMGGAGLRWAPSGNQPTLLLDTTPGSFDGKDDSAIVPGQTFSDTDSGIHITTVGLGDTTPQSIQVMVNKGLFPGNRSPALAVSRSATNIAPGATVQLTATAVDPDGDALAYAWDFGDRSFGANAPQVSARWNSAGLYLVRCVASDMKGGTASESVVIRVGSPSTHLVTGRITLDGKPLPATRVSVSTSQATLSDTDGKFQLAGLAAGIFTLNAELAGYSFIHPGFTNPVHLVADLDHLDFFALPLSGQSKSTLVNAGSMWRYLDNGSDQGAGWSKPEFDDASWKEGAARLGYGDADVNTVIGYGTNSSKKFITTYFRHTFEADNPAQYSSLTLSVVRDDGAVVYLNGREVFRSNLPAGAVSCTTRASSSVTGADEFRYYDADVNAAMLVEGENVLAVEIHQYSPTSTDIGFDLQLVGLSVREAMVPQLNWNRSGASLELSWPATAVGWDLFAATNPGLGGYS